MPSVVRAVNDISLAILSKFLPERVRTREEQEIIVDLVVLGMVCRACVHRHNFQPGVILVDSATEDTAKRLRTIAPKLQSRVDLSGYTMI